MTRLAQAALDAEPETGPVNTSAPQDPLDSATLCTIYALEATDALSRKAEAAGVLFGEPLFRELDIAAHEIRSAVIQARDAITAGRHQRDHRVAELAAAVDQWAADYNRTTGTLDALVTRIEELEAALVDEPPLGGPSERARSLIAALGAMGLNPDEAAHIANALRNPALATPPAEPQPEPVVDRPTARDRWVGTGHSTNRPITLDQADRIVAARVQYGLPAGTYGTFAEVTSWLDWARAGFPETPTPDTIANRPADPGQIAPEAGQ